MIARDGKDQRGMLDIGEKIEDRRSKDEIDGMMNSTGLNNTPILIFDDARNDDTVERRR